ncbi:hypothetical protein [uncultured Cohaesibacter sp.]|uniref:hypothetical protein n=1 Tax=uncultured Cohaesibacter sp. TaxID=1002546 RepID=UPI0029C8834B|nr:hypothetical protein [uncultured Cohaesibacter sp.]
MAKGQLITFPKGTSVYPALNRPDTKFDELGQYKADFKLPLEVAQPYIDRLLATWKSHVGKAAKKTENPMFYFELDDDGEETGNVVFKVRVKNKIGKNGKLWDRKPCIIDAQKGDFPVDVAVWGGTVYRVQAEVYEWMASGKKGVSLQPIMVQIIDLKTGGSKGDASAFDEEDGFTAPPEAGNRSAFDDDSNEGTSAPDDEDY